MLSLTVQSRILAFYFASRLLGVAFIALSFAYLELCAHKPAVVTGSIASVAAAGPKPQSAPLRYRVVTKETATFYVGKQGKFEIVLLDQYGKRVDAPTDLETTITVTTLQTLDEANNWLAYKEKGKGTEVSRFSRKASQTRMVTLARGQEASRTKIIHRKGEEDETIYLLSNQPGPLHIFVESENIVTGDTFVLVLKSKRATMPPSQFSGQRSSDVRIIPIQFQTGQVNQFKLDFLPSKRPTFKTEQGYQIARFRVILQSATDQYEEAPKDISVILEVQEGYASFNPNELIIHRGQPVSNEEAVLSTRAGGSITVKASTSGAHNITPVSRTYAFEPGVHSTSLSVQKQRESAYANGLDEIELRVAALQDNRVITPEEEGMDERRIFFKFVGDSQGVKFENGKNEISIPKGQTTGTIKLFSVRSVSDLKVVAESWNGLRDQIKSAEEVSINFAFPWFPMLCALLGGITFPLLIKRDRRGLIQGLVVGGLFFILAFFRAVLSDPQKVGAVSVAVAKLPTENALASFILGFLGSILLGAIFFAAERYRSSTPA
jgi:hypothetical protein